MSAEESVNRLSHSQCSICAGCPASFGVFASLKEIESAMRKRGEYQSLNFNRRRHEMNHAGGLILRENLRGALGQRKKKRSLLVTEIKGPQAFSQTQAAVKLARLPTAQPLLPTMM